MFVTKVCKMFVKNDCQTIIYTFFSIIFDKYTFTKVGKAKVFQMLTDV